MKLNLGIRRRLAPPLDNGRDEIQLMTILFSLPGSPVIYYGDEIALGHNVSSATATGCAPRCNRPGDRNGGFSRADFAHPPGGGAAAHRDAPPARRRPPSQA